MGRKGRKEHDKWAQVKCEDGCGRNLKHPSKEPRNRYKLHLCEHCLRKRDGKYYYKMRKKAAMAVT